MGGRIQTVPWGFGCPIAIRGAARDRPRPPWPGRQLWRLNTDASQGWKRVGLDGDRSRPVGIRHLSNRPGRIPNSGNRIPPRRFSSPRTRKAPSHACGLRRIAWFGNSFGSMRSSRTKWRRWSVPRMPHGLWIDAAFLQRWQWTRSWARRRSTVHGSRLSRRRFHCRQRGLSLTPIEREWERSFRTGSPSGRRILARPRRATANPPSSVAGTREDEPPGPIPHRCQRPHFGEPPASRGRRFRRYPASRVESVNSVPVETFYFQHKERRGPQRITRILFRIDPRRPKPCFLCGFLRSSAFFV